MVFCFPGVVPGFDGVAVICLVTEQSAEANCGQAQRVVKIWTLHSGGTVKLHSAGLQQQGSVFQVESDAGAGIGVGISVYLTVTRKVVQLSLPYHVLVEVLVSVNAGTPHRIVLVVHVNFGCKNERKTLVGGGVGGSERVAAIAACREEEEQQWGFFKVRSLVKSSFQIGKKFNKR